MPASATIKTTCAYCGVGCGIAATPEGAAIRISGDKTHPANLGRLCSKGTALAETLVETGRLAAPRVDGHPSDWETALDAVAGRWQSTIDAHGPNSVAFYLSGQLLTEDYYVANKLMKGFIGSANVDTNSRLCMSSSVVGHKRAFGTDTVPGCYEDLELADLIILTGSNTAWCHPVLFQRIKAAKAKRPNLKVVVIDPRRTDTCEIADLHLGLKSGTDAFLFMGLLAYLARQVALDFTFLEHHVEGFGAALNKALDIAPDTTQVARLCGLPEESVAQFFDWFRRTPNVVTAYSQGINQSSSGSDKVNAIINCHLATGRIGKPGMGPFSLTGQPNAMGGREVGGLANQLAAHLDFDPADVDLVGRFWSAPQMATEPGLKAVDLFDAVDRGQIKAIWIIGTNPVVSMPEADRVAAALKKCPLVIVSDCIENTDTTAYAHILLPAQGWGEKDGTVTNSERRISRQRALLPSYAEAKPDWWIVTQVAQRLGFRDAFAFESPHSIFLEHAALSAFENTPDGRLRDFNLAALTQLTEDAYNQLEPVQWPVYAADGMGTDRLFGDGQFFTPSRKAQMLAIDPALPAGELSPEYPLVLNTGRIRDQWHTMTRTSLAPRLNQHIDEPFCQIHPADALPRGIKERDLVEVSTATGTLLARARISDEQRPGNLFAPMHWGNTNSAQGRIGPLVNAITDPHSGQPESKHTPASIRPWATAWNAFVFTRAPLTAPDCDYWVKVGGDGYARYELAGSSPLETPVEWLRCLLPISDDSEDECLEYHDENTGQHRLALIQSERLVACVFFATRKALPEHTWINKLFNQDSLSSADRMALLSGMPPKGASAGGKTVCACFNVGEEAIRQAVKAQKLTSVEAIGACLQAGTNCGSCLPELKKFIS